MIIFIVLISQNLLYAFNEDLTAVHYSIVTPGIDEEIKPGILHTVCRNIQKWSFREFVLWLEVCWLYSCSWWRLYCRWKPVYWTQWFWIIRFCPNSGITKCQTHCRAGRLCCWFGPRQFISKDNRWGLHWLRKWFAFRKFGY